MDSHRFGRRSPTETDGTDGNENPRRRYSLHQLAEIANVPPRRIRSWIRAGLLPPPTTNGASEGFSFHQVRTATVLAKMARNGIGTLRLRAILDQLRRRYSNANEALSQLDLCDGLLVLRDADSRLTSPNGQLILELLEDGDSSSTVALKLDAAGFASRADHLFEKAVDLEQAGDLEEAARAYRECLQQSGPELATCFNLANVLSDLGHAEAASERYWQVVEIDPEYAPAWNNLGLALSAAGEADDALRAWRRAVELDEDSTDALFNLADALQEAGRFDEARPHWEAYLRVDGDSEWSSYARFCLDGALR